MKKLFKLLGLLLLALIIVGGIYFVNNEALPEGKKGIEADGLAIKMFNAINHEAFENTETLKWSFRDKHFYTWNKRENIVHISWDEYKVTLHTKYPEKSNVYIDGKLSNKKEFIKQAEGYFNNDSFWLIAPYKIFDKGTERTVVKHNGKDALLVTYASGGTTPGDSYLWILDDNYFPVAYKMWTKIIPIGGVSATWSDWKITKTGIKLPTKHKLSLFGLQIDMGNVQAFNDKADELANNILKAVKHNAYKTTRYLEWSFAEKRSYKWDKEKHIVDVSWDSIRVHLYPQDKNLSTVFFNNELQTKNYKKFVRKAWNFFNNDSFWLVAPHKLFDDGVVRSLEKIKDKEFLKVTYTKGGTTPGDAYIWLLDTNYVPKSYKMYLANKKMNGTPATWQDWIVTESGTLLPTSHVFKNGKKLSMGTVKGYN